eukprot:75484-Rhodomonas_salina.1
MSFLLVQPRDTTGGPRTQPLQHSSSVERSQMHRARQMELTIDPAERVEKLPNHCNTKVSALVQEGRIGVVTSCLLFCTSAEPESSKESQNKPNLGQKGQPSLRAYRPGNWSTSPLCRAVLSFTDRPAPMQGATPIFLPRKHCDCEKQRCSLQIHFAFISADRCHVENTSFCGLES